MNTILNNREFQIEGSWYAPGEKLMNFKSVLSAKLLNTSSSAGDWDGFFFQLINGVVYGIPFYQENNWPRSNGYTLHTGDIFSESNYYDWDQDTENKIIKEYCEMPY